MKKSIGLRPFIVIAFTIFGIGLIATIFPVLQSSVRHMEEDLIANRLVADIHYIEDLIGDGDWNLKDDYICRGDVKVGDGIQEHANLEPFLLHEEKTGTFSYVFIRCSDEGLSYVESTPTQAGYEEGHFLRVAGSTKDPNGNSIVGTYMDKKVADILDAYDTYDGEANVAGGMIYCRYDTLKDRDGKVIGAIVVGRGIEELKAQIADTLQNVIYAGVAIIVLGCTLLILIMNRWVSAMKKSTLFLNEIETGNIPDRRLTKQGLTEVDILNQGINSLADTLEENEKLRVKSETDQLTGLANRFGLNHHGGMMFDEAVKNKVPVSLGIIDIDYFKAYNDNYGHQIGDECILRVANVLRALEEPGRVFAARYGGDEFILMTCGMGAEELEDLADRLRTQIIEEEIPHAYSKVSSVVTLSQGHYISVPEDGDTLSNFFSIADTIMYDVKNGTKNEYKIQTARIDPSETSEKRKLAALSGTIEWNTYHDYLTQLFNREGFYRQVARILKNNPDKEYYLVRSNIRDFKLVNQLFGYEKGNEVLVATAEMLRGKNLNIEVAGRIHGDHFVFLIAKENYDEKKMSDCFFRQSKRVEGSQYSLQYQIGVYEIKDKSMDVSIMCDRANIAISSMHPESDIAISYYDDSMMENILRENEVIAEFENALSEGQFRVYLQPIFDSDEDMVGAEALVRWARKEDEPVLPPSEFIGVLENAGLIHKLDAYVWEEAAGILKKFAETKLKDIFVSVNVSPQDSIYIDIEQTFEDLIERYGILRDHLNPEFTETTLITDVERYIELVSSLRQKGFHVEIDDFGTGYSSLNMLKDISADILKIDKNFLDDTENRDRNTDILASIIEMAKKLNMSVIAEGVEKESQFKNLSDMGCDMFQGYYFAKPMPLDEFEEKYLQI